MARPAPTEITFTESIGFLRLYHQLCLGFLSELLAHEINNILMGLSGYAQMALDAKKESIYQRAAEVFQEGTSTLKGMVKHVQMFALEPLDRLQPIDPNQSVLLVEMLVGRHLSKRNIQFTSENKNSFPIYGNMILLAVVILGFALRVRDVLISEEKSGEIVCRITEDAAHGVQIHLSESNGCVNLDLSGPHIPGFYDQDKNGGVFRTEEDSGIFVADGRDLIHQLFLPCTHNIVSVMHGEMSYHPCGPLILTFSGFGA